jgi:hypothetical protein
MAKRNIRKFGSTLLAPGFQQNGVLSLIATTTLNRQDHAGRTLVINKAAGLTVTLPASTGTGRHYKFLVGTTITSGTIVIQVANGTDVLTGGILINDIGDTTAATSDFFPTAATSDTVTLTAAIGAGKAGDWIEFEDYAAGFYAVKGTFQGETDPANPFSAAVS